MFIVRYSSDKQKSLNQFPNELMQIVRMQVKKNEKVWIFFTPKKYKI